MCVGFVCVRVCVCVCVCVRVCVRIVEAVVGVGLVFRSGARTRAARPAHTRVRVYVGEA